MCTFSKPNVGKLTPFWQILQWYSAGDFESLALTGLVNNSSEVSSADWDCWEDLSGEEVEPLELLSAGDKGFWIWIGVEDPNDLEVCFGLEEGVLFFEDVDSNPY